MNGTFAFPFARPNVGAEEAWAARKAVAAGELTSGGFLAEAQARLADFCGVRPGQVVLTSSGTAALWLAYRDPGLPEEGCVPALTFPATMNAAPEGKYTVYDVGLDTPQYYVVVGLWGRRPRIEDELAVADYCQCIGSLPPERNATTCYSFNSSKPITAAGGGCAVFASVEDANHCTARLSPRNVGGGSWGMSNVQAAILCIQLKRWPELRASRVDVLDAYAKALPIQPKYNVAVVSVPGQACSLVARLADLGVEAKQPWTLGGPELYPMANAVRDSLVALPTWGKPAQAAEVARLVKKACHLEGIRL